MGKEQIEIPKTKPKRNWWITLAVCFAVVAATAGLIWVIQSTEPTAQRVTASKKGAMLVEVVEVKLGDFRPLIQVMGLVKARDEVALMPQVSGEVVSRSEVFDIGNFVTKGDLLITIDSADYENQLAQTLSDLHQAEASLALERGQQDVARNEFELMSRNREFSPENAALILRKPQLAAAQAQVEAAKAAVAQAELELSRTLIHAPFDAQILSRDVSVGSRVSAGQEVAQLVGVDQYWVTASVPLDKLQVIEIPGLGSSEGSKVSLRNRTSWEKGVFRVGRVENLMGALDASSRLAQLNIIVNDPLSREASQKGKPPIIIGSVLQVSIEGKPLEDVIRLDRDYLRKNDTVWVMQEGLLHIASVEVVFKDQDFVYIREGLADGAQVVTTGLSAVVEGAPLRTTETVTVDS